MAIRQAVLDSAFHSTQAHSKSEAGLVLQVLLVEHQGQGVCKDKAVSIDAAQDCSVCLVVQIPRHRFIFEIAGFVQARPSCCLRGLPH